MTINKSEYSALFERNLKQMSYADFMAWKPEYDKIPRDDGRIFTLPQALAAIKEGENDWEALTDRVGRDYLPEIFEAVQHRLTGSAYIAALIDSWTGPDSPEAKLPLEHWVEYFRQAGFTHDGEVAQLPSEPVFLFRGSRFHFGMSWTATPSVAESFAKRNGGSVWTAQVPPQALLAYINHSREGEDEYVIDPSFVTSGGG